MNTNIQNLKGLAGKIIKALTSGAYPSMIPASSVLSAAGVAHFLTDNFFNLRSKEYVKERTLFLLQVTIDDVK